MRKFNAVMTIFWIVMIPVSVFFGWINSVPYVSALSIYALVTGHLSAWQSARVEETQERDDTPQRVKNIEGEMKRAAD